MIVCVSAWDTRLHASSALPCAMRAPALLRGSETRRVVGNEGITHSRNSDIEQCAGGNGSKTRSGPIEPHVRVTVQHVERAARRWCHCYSVPTSVQRVAGSGHRSTGANRVVECAVRKGTHSSHRMHYLGCALPVDRDDHAPGHGSLAVSASPCCASALAGA